MLTLRTTVAGAQCGRLTRRYSSRLRRETSISSRTTQRLVPLPNAHGFPVSGVYGNALMKIAASCKALNMADYFTVHNTVSESSAD